MARETIIIKKLDDDRHHAHHGGGWKVAYADFMTAMMAFFLMLWILAASDEEKLRGLADYFTPSLSEAGGRGQGVLDGQVLGPDGVMSGTEGPKSEVQLPSFGQENPLAVFDSRLRDEAARETVIEYEPAPREGASIAETAAEVTPEQLEIERQRKQREARLEVLQDEIEQAIKARPDLEEYAGNLRFDRTPEGLRVQIVDREGRPMFASGSARIEDKTRDLIRIIGAAVVELPNPLAISGHTDAVPYASRAGYGNWELSADRANATRRILLDAGVHPARISRISGLADTAPLNVEDPEAPENRRISVLLEYPDPALTAAGD
ncbi:flagellar motor protein MotB [Actibacterium sp. MT2.3-13A]|uniref:flagellar motor protein MotB n=1 Tax=Actibacterium sp. MT2.3-13A TaxID=2828332 RepID=UPI001BABB250|nr:flagellar motor protein MotB [Actibacterium sp. MT2.3-13A]